MIRLKPPNWTPEEDALLVALWDAHKDVPRASRKRVVAQLLSRSVPALNKRASRLRLPAYRLALRPKKQDRCGHCGALRRIESRGLCACCFRTPEIRERYLPRHRMPPAPQAPDKVPVPCACRPGSAGKVAVLEARVANGEYLWHPLDAPGRGE